MAYHAPGYEVVIGQTLGHCRIIAKLGAGGMGEVYRAHDEHLDREVAIKVLPPGTLPDEPSRKRFHKEAMALSRLNHPNIATVHDFDTQHGVDFLVMEYIPGITLSEKLDHRPFSEKEIVALGMQLAEGLSAAHEHGVIHRDLKPSNLRVTTDGRLKILDFGLAKLRGSSAHTADADTESLSHTNTLSGTLPYMAPEQLLGGDIDVRTDLHAAGAVLYEMATGQRPFAQLEQSRLISAILHKSPQPPSTLNPRLSSELERIIGKCLEKEPENRYQSARELSVDLRRLAREKESGSVVVEPPPPARIDFVRKHKVIIATTVVTFILLAAAVIFWIVRSKKMEAPAHTTPSIAVLPFVDLSAEKDQEYFSDGLAEELLNSLAKIPELHVAARTSAFQFKGKNEDLRVIGQKLGVATVLEGSVRKQGKRVRISTQLIQVSDGFHLWSEAYDRDLTDIFAVQEDIARSVADALKVKLLGKQITTKRTASIEAYNAYLQGKHFYARRNSESIERAIAYYEQAVKLDANFATAWAALSLARGFQAGSFGPLEEGYRQAREEAERALELDPSLADGYAALGSVKTNFDWDWVGADDCYQRALALDPGNADVIEGAAWLAATLNHFDVALRLDRQLVELNPLGASSYHLLSFHAWWSGRGNEAAAAVKKALEINPDYPWLHSILSSVYLVQGRPQEALAEAERETRPEFRLQGRALAYHALGQKQESDQVLAELVSKYSGVTAYQIAQVYGFRAEPDSAFLWLDRAYEQRDPGLSFVKGDPLLKNIQGDPRYAAFLKKMRLND